jgi:hypothetical protein
MAHMDTNTMIVIAVVLVAAVVAFAVWQTQKTRRLRDRFGSEYGRAVGEVGSRRKAEAELKAREHRVKSFDIRPLSPVDRDRFVKQWRDVQSQFVDDPNRAICDADRLLGEIMSVRGYPMADFDQRSADLSVDHPDVVENYRLAHDIALAHGRGYADTEDLRQAMIHYRALFEDLVGDPADNRRPHSASHTETRDVRH